MIYKKNTAHEFTNEYVENNLKKKHNTVIPKGKVDFSIFITIILKTIIHPFIRKPYSLSTSYKPVILHYSSSFSSEVKFPILTTFFAFYYSVFLSTIWSSGHLFNFYVNNALLHSPKTTSKCALDIQVPKVSIEKTVPFFTFVSSCFTCTCTVSCLNTVKSWLSEKQNYQK